MKPSCCLEPFGFRHPASASKPTSNHLLAYRAHARRYHFNIRSRRAATIRSRGLAAAVDRLAAVEVADLPGHRPSYAPMPIGRIGMPDDPLSLRQADQACDDFAPSLDELK